MRIEWRWVPMVAMLSFVLPGCQSTQETATTDTQGGIGEETTEAAKAVGREVEEVADRTEDALDNEVTVTLTPVAESTVSGDVDLSTDEAATRVEVELTGLTAGSTYTPEIHSGACTDAGGAVAELEPIVASGMEAASTSTIDPSVLAEEADRHIAVMDEGGTMVACGELPAEEAEDIR